MNELTQRQKAQLRNIGKKTYVYQIYFPNKKRYIGITHNLENRFKNHKDAIGDTPLYRSIRKVGVKNVIFSLLVVCQTRLEAAEYEVLYIKKFKTLLSENGYNLTTGGDGGWVHDLDTRNKIAILGGGKPFYAFKEGKTYGPFTSQAVAAETLGTYQQNIGKVLLGTRHVANGYHFRYVKNDDRNVPKYVKENRFNAYKDGKVIGEYSNNTEAANALNLVSSNISACLQGRRGSTGGYTFKFIDPNYKPAYREPKSTYKKVQVFKNGESIGIFNNVLEIASFLNIKKEGINQCLKGNRKQNYGYTFQYLPENNKPPKDSEVVD